MSYLRHCFTSVPYLVIMIRIMWNATWTEILVFLWKVIFFIHLRILASSLIMGMFDTYQVSLVVVQAPKFMAWKPDSRDPVSSILGLNRCLSC